MPQRRVDEVYEQLLALDYSEENARELAYDNNDLEFFEYLSLFVQLRTKGFDDQQALTLVKNGYGAYNVEAYETFLPSFNDDSQVTVNMTMLYFEMLDNQLEQALFEAIGCAQRRIANGTIQVEKEELDKDGEITVGIDAYYDQSTVLLAQDQDVLLPAWRQLATAINSSNKSGIISLCVRHIELGKEVLDMLVPLLGSLDKIALNGNQIIGSLGVKLISECLASNPIVSILYLEENLLNDADADMLANSLKSNTNLRKLGITVGNSITPVGLKSFLSAVLNTSSFNAISDSNHTCWVANRYEGLSKLNTHLHSKVNNTQKLMIALDIEANMPLLSTIPIELMPRVLYLIQGRGFFESQSSGLFVSGTCPFCTRAVMVLRTETE